MIEKSSNSTSFITNNQQITFLQHSLEYPTCSCTCSWDPACRCCSWSCRKRPRGLWWRRSCSSSCRSRSRRRRRPASSCSGEDKERRLNCEEVRNFFWKKMASQQTMLTPPSKNNFLWPLWSFFYGFDYSVLHEYWF